MVILLQYVLIRALVFTQVTHHVQAVLHFRTLKLQQDGSLEKGDLGESVVDDTRTMATGPFELLIGREFKLNVWEEMVKTMRVGEIARFRCPFEVFVVIECIYNCDLITQRLFTFPFRP